MRAVVICLAVLLAVAYAFPQQKDNTEKYTDKFDNIDVQRILHNDRLLNSYFKCIMGRGNCSPEGTELKKILPDALATHCSKCSDKQKEGIKEVITFLTKNKREMWDELKAKFDPEGNYEKEFQEEAKEFGVKTR